MFNNAAIQGNAFYSMNFNKIKYVSNGIFCVNNEGYIDEVYEEDHKFN